MNPKNEPVRIAGWAAGLVAALVSFGVPIPEQYRELVAGLLVTLVPIAFAEPARLRSWGPVTVAKIEALAAKAGK